VNLTAQQMLASLPVRRYADGGEATNVVPSWQADASAGRARAIAVGNEEAWLAQVKATAEKYMQNPGTAAEAYDAMVKSGIGIKDLLDSGISQDTINRALSIPTAEAQKQVNALATTAITSTLAQNPTLANEIANRGAPAIYEQARQFVANLQKDGLTDAERQYMQQVASQQGWGYSDIRAAGIDPTILFSPVPEVKKPPVTPVTPAMPATVTPVFPAPVPYTPVQVYQPLPTQPDIYAPGQPALDVAFRESAPRTAIPGMPGSYEYTPAAKLRPATGAGYSWTPPSVTSRPRSLLSPTLLSYVSPSQQFAQSRAAQDQALLGAFRSSGLPQNASNFYSWRNRLRSGEFGAGSAFNPTAFQSAFSSWASSQPPAAGTTAQGSAAPLGSVTGYSEIAGGLQPIDLRAMPFAEGGEVSAREMLARLKKPEGTEAAGPSAEELIAQMDRIGGQPVPGVRAPQTESRSLLQNLVQGAQEIPGTVSRYAARVAGSESPMTTLGQDLSKFGGAVAQGFKESPGEFLLDVLPVVGELRSASDVDKFSRMANEAEAQGNMDLARIYRELVAVSAMGAAPLAGMGARAGKTTLKGAAKAAQEAAAKAAQEAATAAPVSTAREMLDEMGLPVSAYDPEKVAKTTSMQNNPIGEAFNRQIANDVEGALNAYARLPATLNGKVIDTDSFRELSPDYQKNRGLAPSVHEPSSELAKLYFTRFLEKTRGEEGTWLFTGGGPASGKSSGVSRVMEERAQGIVDGTMSKPKQVIENIQRVIEDPTKDVQVVYIDRDPVKAFDLALARAVGMEKEFGTGRTIPIKSFLDMHKASRESIPRIYEEFKDNPRVKFQIWNNNGGPGEQFPTTVDKISTFDYNNAAERMVNRLEEAYRDGQISEEIYRGFKSGPDPRDSSGAAKSTAGRMGQIDRRINEELGKESPTQPTVNTYNINSPVLQGALDTTREVPTVVGHSLDPQLLVRGTNEEPAFKVVQSFTPNNKAATLANIDAIESTFPDPLASTESWMGAQAASFGGEYLPAPPRQALIYRQNPAQLAGMLDKLTPDLKAAVDEGFGYVNSIKNIYNSRIAPPNTTGRLFLWGILSRGVGPAQQEGAFLDVVNGAAPFIDKAVRGEFTEADLGAWKQMVARSIPEGSPGKQVTMNANAAGNLLYQLGQSADGGPSPLTQLHEILSDPRRTGQEFRRSFYQMTNKPGIDNKVVSFIGLVAGKNDLLVMDRIQSRHLWDDGTYGGANIYDGLEGGGLNKIVTGPRGLMITEMLETGLSDTVQKAYAMVGRPQDASLGRMHWETWLIAGNQPVSHSTLQAVRGGNPIGYGVTEGKRNTFSSNMTYRQAINGPIVEYPLSTGEIVRMTPTRQKEFEDFIRDKENGIIPKGFMVSESTDKPWFEQPGVDRRKLDEAARQFENANPDGSLRSGDVRDTQGGGTVSERRSQFLTDFRRDRLAVAASELQGRADRRNLAEVAGPYTRETLQADGRDGLLSFVPDNTARTLYQSAGLSVPNIRQLPSSSAASFVDGMRASMSRNSTAPQVEIKSPEELAGYRLFRTDAGSGFAIKPDGDIVSVFASPSETRGSSYAMLQAAVQAGGKKLDAFNTYLPDIYKRVGFRPVSRIPWNDDFAPPNWNKEVFREYNNGQPDIMFFVHDPNYFGESVDVPYAKDYDDAVRIQTDALNRLSPQPAEVPNAVVNTTESSRPFKKGGMVERVTSDNRKYF